jgi:hypothetical protein
MTMARLVALAFLLAVPVSFVAAVVPYVAGLWLVLLGGWILFLVISARRARRAAAQAAPPKLT